MTLSPTFSYDEVPYPNLSHASTHPDFLATLAKLAGMQPAPVEKCRVLELGTAAGGNLIPMAYALPGSAFVGIDLSAVQIQDGLKQVQATGLKNLQLIQMDIMDLPDELGTFDYIIAHGVFSWVPEPVREQTLAIYRKHLAPQGVGFISFNTYPGWHMIDIARGMMRYAIREIQEPARRVEEARKAIRFLADANPVESGWYASFLKLYADSIEGKNEGIRKDDSALLHDELEDMNQPFYFHEFVEKVERHGLQYLGELCEVKGDAIPADQMAELRSRSKTLVELEQYCDFLLHRTFRRSLVCHQEVALDRKITPAKARNFFFSSQARPVSEAPNITEISVERFEGQDGGILSINHPLSKAAMLCLEEAWPQALSFDEIFGQARERLVEALNGTQPDLKKEEALVLGANLFKAYAYSQSLVELRSQSLPLTTEVADFPVASRVARLEVLQQEMVTNMRHERVELEWIERFLLPLLDGTRDLKALTEALIQGPVAEGVLTLEKEGQPLPLDEQRAVLEAEVMQGLAWLARAGLLVDPEQLGD